MKYEDDKGYIAVPLHRSLPSWWEWAIHGTIIGSLAVFSIAGLGYVPYLLGGLAITTTHLMFKVYNAFVRYANEQRLKDTITQLADRFAAAEAEALHESADDATSSDACDAAGHGCDKDSLIKRYESVLELIQKTETIGEARDIAWRALEQRDARPETI